ncbi:MAG: PD-(D/E)XK nuclease family protein [Anaerolineales bacterium]|nr:PD-(D/E)XK nuclease family protein [Anaerolineales bacterium]
MILPDDFRFSQASLQDYVDCPRRFYLRYRLRLPWPAIETAPFLLQEEHARQGRVLHRMIQQHLLGVPVEKLTIQPETPDLERWWDHYCSFPLPDLPSDRRPEFQLSAPLGNSRLLAKYDLLAIEPGARYVIVDWKTSLRRPLRDALIDRLQTRVYRFLLVHAGKPINSGVPIYPEEVQMRYWFAEFPEDTIVIDYTEEQYRIDGDYLLDLVEEIGRRADDEFHKTEQEKRCIYCRYRSLCARGVKAGEWFPGDPSIPEMDLNELDLKFDELPEVAL